MNKMVDPYCVCYNGIVYISTSFINYDYTNEQTRNVPLKVVLPSPVLANILDFYQYFTAEHVKHASPS